MTLRCICQNYWQAKKFTILLRGRDDCLILVSGEHRERSQLDHNFIFLDSTLPCACYLAIYEGGLSQDTFSRSEFIGVGYVKYGTSIGIANSVLVIIWQQ